MTALDACTSGTSRVLIIAYLQRLEMEALIPAPADCKVRSMIKFLNEQNIAPIEIHRQVCQVYGHTRLDGQHISCRCSIWMCLIIIHPIDRTSRPVVSIFSYISNSCSVNVIVFRGWDGVTVVPISERQSSTNQDTNVVTTVWWMSQFRECICWKMAEHLLYLFQ